MEYVIGNGVDKNEIDAIFYNIMRSNTTKVEYINNNNNNDI